MSDDGNNKQFNGACVTLDSNFASAVTIENFFKLFLQRLQSDEQTSHKFATETLSDLDVTVIPIGLRNLGLIKSEHTKKRDNYATERAEYECGAYASLFAPRNDPKYSDFYQRGFFKTFTNVVVDKFSLMKFEDRSTMSGGTTIKVLSDVSYARVGDAMVNILLGYNLKGELNLVRRRKINPATVVKNENGELVSFEYYTDNDIAEYRERLYKEFAENLNYHDLDICYIPNRIHDVLMNLSVLSSCKRHGNKTIPADFDVRTIFDLNHPNPRIRMMYTFLLQNAITDLANLERLERRTQNKYTVNNIIQHDSTGAALRENNAMMESLSVKEIYISFLVYMKYIVILAEPLIEICDTIDIESMSLSEKIGIVEHENSYINRVYSILSDFESLSMICNEELIFFNLPDYIARYLTFFMARAFTSVTVSVEGDKYKFDFGSLPQKVESVYKQASTILALKNYEGDNASSNPFFKMFFERLDGDKFAKLIFGYQEDDDDKMSISEINNFYNNVYSKKKNNNLCEIHILTMLKILTDKSEDLNCYIHRNIGKYMLPDDSFSYDIALIENVVSYFIAKSSHHRRNNIVPFNITGKNIIFNVEMFLDTVRRITGIASIDMNIEPISHYKKIVDGNMESIDNETKKITSQLDNIFGESFIRPIVPLPEIPYDEKERRWAIQKCEDLEVEAESIIGFSTASEDFDWTTFRESYNVFRDATEEYARSNVDDPALVKQINDAETLFKQFSELCGLDSAQLEKLKSIYQSIYSYSHLDKMRFSFKPFEFKSNTEIGFDMEFVISDNIIIVPNSSGDVDQNGIKKRYVSKPVQVISKLYNGKQILDEYFRPFFEPFARTNKESFNVDVVIHDSNDPASLKKNLVVLNVKFGSVKDLHECSKFRTFFFSIRDKAVLYDAVREHLGMNRNDTEIIATNNIPKQFIIRWNKTKTQANALSGTDKSKTFKFYDEAKGCVERYPFFDDIGPRIIQDAFKYHFEKFLKTKERRALPPPRVQRENRVRVEVDDNTEFPMLAGSFVPLTTNHNEFWNFRNDKGEIQGEETIGSGAQGEEKPIKKNYDSRRKRHERKDIKQLSNPFSVLDEKKSIERENQPKAVYQHRINARERMQSQIKDIKDKNGWQVVKHKGRTLHGKKKTRGENSTPNNIRSKTPSKFRNGRSGDRNERNTGFRTGSGTRKSASGGHSESNTFISSRNGTPNSNGKFESYKVSSPGFADKRAGGEFASSPSYFHPNNESAFIGVSPSVLPINTSFTMTNTNSPSISLPTAITPDVIIKNENFEENDDDWD